MKDHGFLRWLLLLGCWSVLGCEDQQYVSPHTVSLVVRDKATDLRRVNHCSFVPVLLGSRDEALYDVDGTLTAKFTLTRERITVSFDGADVPLWGVASKEFDSEVTKIDDNPPDGYAVELSSPCTPDDL